MKNNELHCNIKVVGCYCNSNDMLQKHKMQIFYVCVISQQTVNLPFNVIKSSAKIFRLDDLQEWGTRSLSHIMDQQ